MIEIEKAEREQLRRDARNARIDRLEKFERTLDGKSEPPKARTVISKEPSDSDDESLPIIERKTRTNSEPISIPMGHRQ